jgi:hypothetical protein
MTSRKIAEESVRDTACWIRAAMRETEALKKEFPDTARDLHWLHLYHRELPTGVQTIESSEEQQGGKKTANQRE